MEESSSTTGWRPLPPTYFNLSWMAMIAIHLLLPLFRFISFPYTLSGIPFLLLGLWMNLWGSRQFNKVNTTVKPFEKPATLITSGFFRHTRHPMYLGMIFALLGTGLLLGSLTPFLILPVFKILITRHFIIPEEKALKETFGQEYQNYTRQVRRWL